MIECSSVADWTAKIREKRAKALRASCPDRLNGCRAADVRNVLIINAASRSGSSFLHHLLSKHPDVVSLNGESIVFEKLHGICRIDSIQDSDTLAFADPIPDRILSNIAEDMLRDSGTLHNPGSKEPFPRDEFLADSVQRLFLQYPELDLDSGVLHGACARALRGCVDRAGPFSSSEYWIKVLNELRNQYPEIDPKRYDLGLRKSAGGRAMPLPFSERCLEEPPFVAPAPRRLPSPDILAKKTLLLKSTSNCYHLPLVKRMFPNARFKFAVLARNPAASINGLMEGWLSDGFHSRNLGRLGDLKIRGYSSDRKPGTRRWWKFDLPPGWSEFRDKSLEAVCAFQWRSANEHILKDIRKRVIDAYVPLRYESFLDPTSLNAQILRLLEFAELDPGSLDGAHGRTPVMSVTPPSAGKWRARGRALAPLMADPLIRKTARAWGYDPDVWETWL